MKKMNTKRMVFLAIMTAGALALSVIENALPVPFVAPGARLGLANIMILTTMVLFGFWDGVLVAVLKSALLVLITGAVVSFFYSFVGSVLAVIAMYAAKKLLGRFLSNIGVSICGAVTHCFGQLLVASYFIDNIRVFTYFPVLILTGLFTGYFVGLVVNQLVKHIRKITDYPFVEWKYD